MKATTGYDTNKVIMGLINLGFDIERVRMDLIEAAAKTKRGELYVIIDGHHIFTNLETGKAHEVSLSSIFDDDDDADTKSAKIIKRIVTSWCRSWTGPA